MEHSHNKTHNKFSIIKTLQQKESTLTFYAFAPHTHIKVPLLQEKVPAGFPSLAHENPGKSLDLNEYLIKHPAATYFVRVEGTSMVDAGINSGDLLIVDRALEPKDGSIVVAAINGEFTVKRVKNRLGSLYLVSENASFAPIKITEDMDFEIWGVVTHAIHSVS
ncbi:MAG: LexA family protein [Candidatus Babeliales bacterium]